jgi:hypothetical protein
MQSRQGKAKPSEATHIKVKQDEARHGKGERMRASKAK